MPLRELDAETAAADSATMDTAAAGSDAQKQAVAQRIDAQNRKQHLNDALRELRGVYGSLQSSWDAPTPMQRTRMERAEAGLGEVMSGRGTG